MGGWTTHRRVARLGRTAALAALIAVALSACRGSPEGPADLGSIAEDPPPHPLTSNDIMEREPQTNKAEVQHVLISYNEVAKDTSTEAAKKRTREEAEALVAEIYDRAVAGEDFATLMAEYSDDPGSAKSGKAYTVEPGNSLVLAFRRLGVRLNVGEVGKISSAFGWHIMKRVE